MADTGRWPLPDAPAPYSTGWNGRQWHRSNRQQRARCARLPNRCHRFEGIIVIAIARWCSVLVVSVASSIAYAGGIDHRIAFDDTGVWNRNVQRGVEFGTIAVVVGGASWLGGDDRLGRTFWQAFDSGIASSAGSEVMKHTFTRARPSQTDDPNEWFKGHGHTASQAGKLHWLLAVSRPSSSSTVVNTLWCTGWNC